MTALKHGKDQVAQKTDNKINFIEELGIVNTILRKNEYSLSLLYDTDPNVLQFRAPLGYIGSMLFPYLILFYIQPS